MFDAIVGVIEQGGYLGILFLMFLENIFPPIPSELIMPLAGFLAARGDLNFFAVVLVGTLGSFLGTLPWYFAGSLLGEARVRHLARRHGRWRRSRKRMLAKRHYGSRRMVARRCFSAG